MKYGTEPSNWQDKRIQRRKMRRMWKNLQETHYDYDIATEKALIGVVTAFAVVMWVVYYVVVYGVFGH